MVIYRLYLGSFTKGVTMGMANVLQSIKDAEESANAKIAASKEEAAKILADARKEASDIIQGAQDGAVSSTVKTLTLQEAKQEKRLMVFRLKVPKLLKEFNPLQEIAETQL